MENWTSSETKNNDTNPFDSVEYPEKKKRHGCVTAWFIFGIVVNLIVGLGYLLLKDMLPQAMREMGSVKIDLTPNYFLVEGLVSLILVFCYVQLWQWKKIGFHGMILCTMITASVNFMAEHDWSQFIFSFVGILLQYLILQIKVNGKSAWSLLQ
jgi:hypothetical protein